MPGRKYDNPAAVLAPTPASPTPPPPAIARRAARLRRIPDALTAAQAGYRSVALLGAHTPDPAVAARLANHAANLGLDLAVVCDPDPAGRHVAERLTDLLADHIRPTVITPPADCDVNAWALTDPGWTTPSMSARRAPGCERRPRRRAVKGPSMAHPLSNVDGSGSRWHRRAPSQRRQPSWKEPS